jgi:long-chain acyl-CoA synthetase
MDVLLHLQRSVKCYPDKPAVLDGPTRLTWSQFDERTRRLAAALAQLGVQKGDRVGVLMYNGFRYLEAFYALPRLGAIIVPLNIRYAPAEIAFAANDCEAVALILDEAFIPAVEKIKPELKTVRSFILNGKEKSLEGALAYEEIIETSPGWRQFEDYVPGEDDVLGLFYTGGTTGRSKGVMLTHRNMASNALSWAIHCEVKLDSVYLHVAPMFHIADVQSIFTFTLLGAAHTFLPKFDPVQVLEITQRERVTHMGVVPTMVNLLVQVPNIGEYDLSSLVRIFFGGSPCPAEVLKKARQVLPCAVTGGYGMTETSPGVTAMPWNELIKALEAPQDSPEAKRLVSCGWPVLGVDVRVVDDASQEVAPGELGEIVVRGANVMKGYWKLPEESAFALRDGWLHTGDIGTYDEQNFFYIIDRKKDMIISGGENVYSSEVENAVYSHPAVLEAAVIGVPDEKWGERVHAVIVLKPDQQATPEEIMAKCRELIAGYKIPRSIEFVEEMPKSGAGKILKRVLRDKYWQGQTVQVH